MDEKLAYKILLVFEPQSEGGYTVTCPVLPELITESDTIILEAYDDLNRSLPPVLERVALDLHTPFWTKTAVCL